MEFSCTWTTVSCTDLEEEFLSNLRKVMDRFEKHNIILNPKKCKFVMSSIEYVGHIINQNGFHFGRDKLDEVLQCQYALMICKSFIGMVNYFGDRIQHLAEELRMSKEIE